MEGEPEIDIHESCFELASQYLGGSPVQEGVADLAMTALYEALAAYRRSIFHAAETNTCWKAGFYRGIPWKSGGYGPWVYDTGRSGLIYNPASVSHSSRAGLLCSQKQLRCRRD